MTLQSSILGAFLGTGLLCGSVRAEEPVSEVTVDPAAVRLSGPGASYSLLVHGKTAEGRSIDLTRAARFSARQAKVATVGTHMPRPIWNGFGGIGYLASSALKITCWMGVPPWPPHSLGQVIWA